MPGSLAGYAITIVALLVNSLWPLILGRAVTGFTAGNLWTIDSRGRVRACWLTGTGYVNSLKVVCTQ